MVRSHLTGLGALGAALLAAPAAHAVELTDLVEAWTRTVAGSAGNDGVDEALAVEIDLDGTVIAVGYLDGLAGHGTDGYAIGVLADGTTSWESTLDAGAIGADRTSSDDRYAAIAVEAVSGDLAVCGAVGPEDLADPPTRMWFEAWDAGAPPTQSWVFAYVDGIDSPNQACQGVERGLSRVFGAGWADHGVDVGRWVAWDLTEAAGVPSGPPVLYEYSLFEAVPDRALAVAQDLVTGNAAIAGTRGFAGLDGSLLNDTDAHVRLVDYDNALVWTHTVAGATDLDDQFLAVAMDPMNHDVFVAGHVNEGEDNGPLADLDWWVQRIDDVDDGDQIPTVVWSASWSSAPGASEGATALIIDEVGEVVVGGWTVDAGTGLRRWRVARYDGDYGTPLDEWVGPARAGDSWVTGLALRDGNLAIVGVIDEGAGPEFGVTLLDADLDEDGVADAVDACPDDPEKSADVGICGCNVPDVDTDGDGYQNCVEDCPTDPDKTEPGVCGCELPDDDTDQDGTYDCDDRCPENPDKSEAVGECGCDFPDDDVDGDGVIGCRDACSNTPAGAAVDVFGCPLDGTGTETGDTGTKPVDGGGGGGCGCASGAAPVGGTWLVVGAIAAAARRRRITRRL